MGPRSTLFGRAGLVAVPATVLLAACGAPQPRTLSTAAPGPESTPVSASPSSPGLSVTPASDPQSCRDADCAVEVRPGDRLRFDKSTGLDTLTVVSLDGGVARLRFEGSSGGYRVQGMNVSVSQSCVNGRCRAKAEVSLAPGRPGRIGDVGLRLESVASDRAVLVMRPV